jgi:hypothetical protein
VRSFVLRAVGYTDGRSEDEPVTAKQAADDLNTFRQQRSAELLAEMTGEAQPERQQAAPEQSQQQAQPAATPQQTCAMQQTSLFDGLGSLHNSRKADGEG